MEAATMTKAPEGSSAAVLAGLCHFFEMALAHPGEDGVAYFSRQDTESALKQMIGRVPGADGLLPEISPSLTGFFAGLRANSYDDVEAAHIALFTSNFPQVPCPPYGSLFTAEDDSKRLEEMLAIKQFYQELGVDVSETFDDLPDHICVELEFLQLLCFREHEAQVAGDYALVAGTRARQAEFFDRFVLPFTQRASARAMMLAPHNPYSHLLDATHRLLAHHRAQLGEILA